MVATLVLGTAEWSSTLKTNQHHVTLALRDHGDTWFVESMGLRRPAPNREDMVRIRRRLQRAFFASGDGQPAASHVVSTPLIPWHRLGTRAINRRILVRAVAHWRERPRRERLLWTYTPTTYGLEAMAGKTVYHCVDLLGAVPGIDARVIDHGERRLASHGVVAIASSSVVAEHLVRQGFVDVRLWRNVADVEPILGVPRSATEPTTAVVLGNLSPWKLDYELLRRLVEADERVHLALAGPLARSGRFSEPVEIAEYLRDRAEWVGVVSPEAVGQLLARATVGLIPYVHSEYTRGVFPLKVFEYLAAGLPVVATGLPSMEPIPGHVWTEASSHQFVAAVSRLLREPTDEERSARVAIARDNSWWVRRQEVAELVGDLDWSSAGNADIR